MKTLIFLITIIAATVIMRAGEMVLEWEHIFGSHVSAFNILPGGDDVLLTVYEGRFEIRRIIDGSLKEDFELQIEGIDIHYAQITPDSSRILIAYGGRSEYKTSFELRSLEDFSLINKFELPLEGDSTSEVGNKYVNRFIDIEIDPIRPFVYFILEKALPLQTSDIEKEYYSIKAFDYETGEEVRELRSYKDDKMSMIDVSDDGRYLASINERESFINIWDLETFSQIKSYQLFRNSPDKAWKTVVSDLRFSKLKSDIIYFSGRFSKIGNPDEFENGVFEYSIVRGNHINRLPDNSYTGRLIFAEDERILFLNGNSRYLFFDFPNKNREYFSQPNKENSISNYAIYSPKYKSFIGHSGQEVFEKEIRSIKYLTQTNIENEDQNDCIIHPNPTNDFLNIDTELTIDGIEILNIEGGLMFTTDEKLIDISQLSSGIYYLVIKSGKQTVTKQISVVR